MDNWLKLDDPMQVKAQAAIIKRLTDPAHFDDFRFMPVTRDMTAGERTLLYSFLDTPIGDETTRAAEAPTVSRFAALSRSLRRG